MSNIDLSRFEVRTGNTASWLYVRAIFQLDGNRARLWCLVSLDADPKYGLGPLFEPDHPEANEGRNDATGTCRLDCGCVNEVAFLHTRRRAEDFVLSLSLPRGDVSRSIETCPTHWRPYIAADPFRGTYGPVDLEASIRCAEMEALRGAIGVRRIGIGPMSFAGICGAAGVVQDAADLARDAQTLESLKTLATLRGHQVRDQDDPAWFRLR